MPSTAVDLNEPAVLEAARRDLTSYRALVHKTDMPSVQAGFALAGRHHEEMDDALMGPGDVAIVMPRDSAKTTVAQSYIEWKIGRASLAGEKEWPRRVRFLYLRSKADLAEQVSLSIQSTIESPVYQAIFPDVLPEPKKWATAEWRVKGHKTSKMLGKDATFTAGGISSPPLGARCDEALLDDVGDKENMETAGQRQKVRDTLSKTVMPMVVPWGRSVIFGTRWAWDDVIDWAEKRGWKMVVRKALTEDDDGNLVSYWPERYPVEKLVAIREADPRSFAQQYQNEVAPEEGIFFERWWFQRRFDLLPSDIAFRFESWDLATGTGRKNDYSVGLCFVIARRCPMCHDAPFHIFIPHMFRGKIGPGYLKMAIADCYQLMGGYSTDHYAVIERKSAGEVVLAEGIPGIPLKARSAVGEGQAAGMKDKRIADIAHLCREGKVHLPSEEFLRTRSPKDWIAALEGELFSYPESQHDDCVSAFVQGCEEVEERRIKWQRLLMQPREPVKFYTRPGVRRAV